MKTCRKVLLVTLAVILVTALVVPLVSAEEIQKIRRGLGCSG
jgi:hypothetical protein